MDKGFDPLAAATEVTRNLVASIADMVPRFLVAILVIVLGLIVAKLAERAIKLLFERLKIDSGLERTGLTSALRSRTMPVKVVIFGRSPSHLNA